MCQMVGYEMKSLPQRTSKKLLGDTAHLAEPQQEDLLKSRIRPPLGAKSRSAQLGIERVCHVIDIAGGEPGVIQAEADRTRGELMRVVDVRRLAMLDAIEPLFLDGGDKFAIDEQRGGRLVVHRVDSKNVHWPTSTPVISSVLWPAGSWDPSQNIEPAGISQAVSRQSYDHRPLLQPTSSWDRVAEHQT